MKCPKCGRKLVIVKDKFFTGETKIHEQCKKCGFVKGDADGS